LPADLAHGQRVDVYVTPKARSPGALAKPLLVAHGALVQRDVREETSRFSSGASEVGVELAVAPGQVAGLVGAIETGAIDLVHVPEGQDSTPVSDPGAAGVTHSSPSALPSVSRAPTSSPTRAGGRAPGAAAEANTPPAPAPSSRR
jgi:hypothetical protein